MRGCSRPDAGNYTSASHRRSRSIFLPWPRNTPSSSPGIGPRPEKKSGGWPPGKKAAETAFERRAFKEAEEAYRQALDIIGTLPERSERDAQELELMIRFVQVLQATTRGWAAPEAADAAARAQTLAEK